MKLKSLLQFVMVLLMGQFIFSCNSARYYEFSAHKHEPYLQKQKPAPAPSLSEVALAAAEEKAAEASTEPLLEASTAPTPAIPVKVATPKVTVPEAAVTEEAPVTITEAEAVALLKKKLASMTKAEKKELKKEVKESLRQMNAGRTSVVEIILAILLPPLAVFLHSGIGTQFWISLLLTLLFFVPGIIYALLVVTDTI